MTPLSSSIKGSCVMGNHSNMPLSTVSRIERHARTRSTTPSLGAIHPPPPDRFAPNVWRRGGKSPPSSHEECLEIRARWLGGGESVCFSVPPLESWSPPDSGQTLGSIRRRRTHIPRRLSIAKHPLPLSSLDWLR